MPGLSIIIPVYRNAQTLEELHRRLRQASGPESELVFVNDASPDGSLAVLDELASQDHRLVILNHPRNLGQNQAVLSGLQVCQGDQVVVLDADLQDPPEAIPLMLEHLKGSTAAVFAGRRGTYESWNRQVSSWAVKHLLWVLSGFRLPPDAGLFLAMDAQMRDSLRTFQVADPYILGLMARSGLKMISIPVARSANPHKQTGYTAWTRLRLAWRAVRSIFP